MALNLFVLNKEAVYQLSERGAMNIGLSSAARAVSLMGTRTKQFLMGEMSMHRSHGSVRLPGSPLLLPLERVCMHEQVYETACSPHSKGIHKKTEFYIFSPWLHCFPLATCNFLIFFWLDAKNLCANTSVPAKA